MNFRRRVPAFLALCCACALGACKSEQSAPASGAVAPSAGPAAGSEIEAGLAFLKVMAQLNHKDQADLAWGELAALGAPKVKLTAGGETVLLDIAGKTAGAHLLKFAKLTSLREGAIIRGVALGEVALKIDKVEHRGPGRLLLEAKGERWVATALEVDAAPAAPAAPAGPAPAAQ